MGYPLFNEYTYNVHDEKKTAKGIPDETKRVYVNTEACKDCPLREECLSEKQHHKTYTIYGSPEKREMITKMKEKSAKKIYKQRAPTVESPFGTLKQFYHIDTIYYTGREKIENMLNLYATAYNLKKIYEKLKTTLNEDKRYITFVQKTINKYKTT